MFERFVEAFGPAQQKGDAEPWLDPRLTTASGYEAFARSFAGATFGDGIYRFVDADGGPRWRGLLQDAFPQFAERACPFGYDWLGRSFALDARRVERGEPLVLLFEPGTGQVLEIPFAFAAFHDSLHDLREPALAASFFDSWAARNREALPLGREQCVGYRTPLFLGGKDTVENLEVTDLEVYWSLSAQLLEGVRGLTPGTAIRGVTRSDETGSSGGSLSR